MRMMLAAAIYLWFFWISLHISAILAFLVLMGAVTVGLCLLGEAIRWLREDSVRWAKAAVAAWWQRVVHEWSGR